MGLVQAFDPQAGQACAAIYGERENLDIVASKEAALNGADVLVICTEWKAFLSPDFDQIKNSLSAPVIIDGRNLYNPTYMKELGIEYYGIGRGQSLVDADVAG